MSTQLFIASRSLHNPELLMVPNDFTIYPVSTGNGNLNELSTARGGGVVSKTRTSVTGPASLYVQGFCGMVDRAVTIAGSITFNLWGLEASMAANAQFQVKLYRFTPLGNSQLLTSSSPGVELGTTNAANTWSATPTSTSFNKGDYIFGEILFVDGGGTMASASTLTLNISGTSAGASGDTYVTFSETFGLLAPAAGTKLYVDASTPQASGATVTASGTLKGLDASNTNTSATATVNTTTGPTSQIQWTTSAGGAAIAWFTDRFKNPTTLAGPIVLQVSMNCAATNNVTALAELYTTDKAGLNPSLIAQARSYLPGLTSPSTSMIFAFPGADFVVPGGGRLKLVLYIDDNTGPDATQNMVGSSTAVLTYDNSSNWLQLNDSPTFGQPVSMGYSQARRSPLALRR